MSVTKRIKQGFLRLPLGRKAIFLSSALLMISTILPWYDSRNSFGVGDAYLGIQGPLFLIGFFCLAFGAVSFFNIFFPLMGRNFFKLRQKSGLVSAIMGMQAMFLILIANSVFYHPSFGLNISHKGTRFGMMMGFISIAVMVVAGLSVHRKEKKDEYESYDIEDIMTNEELAPEPIRMPHAPTPSYSQQSYSTPSAPTISEQGPRYSSGLSRPANAYEGDPLKLDAKTRYKLMQSRARAAGKDDAQTNLWGNFESNRSDY